MYPFDDYSSDSGYDIPFLRRKKMFDEYGGNSAMNLNDDSDMSSLNSYLPSRQTAPPVADVPTGQEAQEPWAAKMFRQSLDKSQQPEEEQAPTKTDWGARYRNLYQPHNEAQTRLNSLLDQFPEQQDPSFARKLTAMFSGFGSGGIKGEHDILNEPNATAMERWKARTEPFEKAAENERQGNVNERTIAQQTIQSEQNQQKIDETERKNRATDKVQTTRAEAYNFKARHPDWKIDFSGPNVMAVAPDGSQSISLGPTGHMTEVDKINLQNAGKVEAAKASGVAAVERIVQAGKNAVTTKQTAPGVASTPLNDARTRNNRFQDVFDEHPEWHDMMVPPATPTGSWQLKPPKGWFGTAPSAEKQDAYNQLYKAIHPETDSTSDFGAAPPSAAPTAKGKSSSSTKPKETSGLGPTPDALEAQHQAVASAQKKATTPVFTAPNIYNTAPKAAPQPQNTLKGYEPQTITPYQDKSAPSTLHDEDPRNPMNQRYSSDGGKTWMYSTDGGQTWSKNPPRGGN